MQVLFWKENVSLHPWSLSSRGDTIICRPFGPPWAPALGGSIGTLCLWVMPNTTCTWSHGERWTHTAHLLSNTLHCCIWLHLGGSGSKIKLHRISKWQEQSIKQNMGPFRHVPWGSDLDLQGPPWFAFSCVSLTWSYRYYAFLDLPWLCFAATCWLGFSRLLWVIIQGF